MTLEEKAKAYAEEKFSQIATSEATWGEVKRSYAQVYLDGATEALNSQWKDPKVELPEDGEIVLVRLGGSIAVDCCAHGVWAKFKPHLIQFWMHIPELPKKGGEA